MPTYSVDLTLSLIASLRKSVRDRQIEVQVLVENLEGYGLAALAVPGYTTVTGGQPGRNGAPDRIDFELKARGSWTPLVVRRYAPRLLVLSDR